MWLIVILDRTCGWHEKSIGETQYGFRQGRGCTDTTWCVKRIQQIRWQQNKDVNLLFLNMQSAYDWVVRSWLWKVMKRRIEERQLGLKFIFERIEDLYSSTYAFMTGDDLNEKCICTSGLHQGGVESPPLYNLWQDTILAQFRKNA